MFLCILFLNEGLVASVNLHVRHNSWLSNGILLFYVSLCRHPHDGCKKEDAGRRGGRGRTKKCNEEAIVGVGSSR